MEVLYNTDFMTVNLYTIDVSFSFDEYVNWNKNRPVDKVRVHQIKEYLLNNEVDFAPGVISCWKKPHSSKFKIYDGIHRFFAIKELIEEDSPRFCYVLIKVLKSTREQDVINDFINLNKSICIPSIYIDERLF